MFSVKLVKMLIFRREIILDYPLRFGDILQTPSVVYDIILTSPKVLVALLLVNQEFTYTIC